jgi:SNF2 family DNA or RNA helicase
MSSDAKATAAETFQANPQIRVIFLTAAGSESIDLQAARGVVFLQPNPSFVATEQIVGRSDRRGQTHPVRTIYMLSPNTVDQRLFELSQQKEERHAQVTRDAELMAWVVSETELAGT